MALELVLLISFVGMTLFSTIAHPEKGLRAQFEDSGPILAARMERRMATGRCMQRNVNQTTDCGTGTVLFSSASTKK